MSGLSIVYGVSRGKFVGEMSSSPDSFFSDDELDMAHEVNDYPDELLPPEARGDPLSWLHNEGILSAGAEARAREAEKRLVTAMAHCGRPGVVVEEVEEVVPGALPHGHHGAKKKPKKKKATKAKPKKKAGDKKKKKKK